MLSSTLVSSKLVSPAVEAASHPVDLHKVAIIVAALMRQEEWAPYTVESVAQKALAAFRQGTEFCLFMDTELTLAVGFSRKDALRALAIRVKSLLGRIDGPEMAQFQRRVSDADSHRQQPLVTIRRLRQQGHPRVCAVEVPWSLTM